MTLAPIGPAWHHGYGDGPVIPTAPAEQQGGLVSDQQASEPAIRAAGRRREDTPDHRRRTSRQVRHTARARLHVLAGDEEALEDADLLCPQVPHDLGRKTSPKPPQAAEAGPAARIQGLEDPVLEAAPGHVGRAQRGRPPPRRAGLSRRSSRLTPLAQPVRPGSNSRASEFMQ